MAISVDPDQTAPKSALFAEAFLLENLRASQYSQTCVKQPYKTTYFGFSDRWLLIAILK